MKLIVARMPCRQFWGCSCIIYLCFFMSFATCKKVKPIRFGFVEVEGERFEIGLPRQLEKIYSKYGLLGECPECKFDLYEEMPTSNRVCSDYYVASKVVEIDSAAKYEIEILYDEHDHSFVGARQTVGPHGRNASFTDNIYSENMHEILEFDTVENREYEIRTYLMENDLELRICFAYHRSYFW